MYTCVLLVLTRVYIYISIYVYMYMYVLLVITHTHTHTQTCTTQFFVVQEICETLGSTIKCFVLKYVYVCTYLKYTSKNKYINMDMSMRWLRLVGSLKL